MNKIRLILLCLMTAGSLVAQNVDVSKLSPEQKAAYAKYTGAAGTAQTATATENVTERTVDAGTQQAKPDAGTGVFGSELFSSQNLTFEPKLNIPTPPSYILGTYDELNIDISGLYEANYKLKVSTEGTIRIPNVGPIKVSGMKMADATRLIRNRVGSIYMGVSTGQTHVNVTLGSIRSIRVTVIGEATRPGTYTLPSLATAFNALYACGGPGALGSMRNIEVIRHGQVVTNIDVYHFLVDGVLKGNIALQDEDVLKISSYKLRVTIKGAVKHNGIFEALPDETLSDLVHFAGGYTDNAYKTNITLLRLTDIAKTVVDVKGSEIPTFALKSGDEYTVSTTYNEFDNRVDIDGSVYRPGAYALESGMTVKQLIAKADGITKDAYLNMAYITRKKENEIPEIIGFALGDVLHGLAPDVPLQKDDKVEIRSLFDYREGQSVSIWGAVKSPGTFPLIENITLKDLIFKARGFSEMASTDSVELIRVIKDEKILLNTNVKTIVKKFALDKDLNFKSGQGDILLENGDQVIVRSISGYEGIRMVRIEGEVIQPGDYNIKSKSERLSDLVSRSGGLTRYAYPRGAYLIRNEKQTGVEKKLNQIMAESAKKQLESQDNNTVDVALLKASGATSLKDLSKMDSIQQKLKGTSNINKLNETEGIVGIDLNAIMHHPGSPEDLYLEESDVLFVPRELQTVRVLGEVLFPTLVRYDRHLTFSDYISNAGGYSNIANKKHAFVLYANGTAKSTKSFLGINRYPTIRPGARIVVPQKPAEIKNRMSTAETISMMSSLATVAALIFSVLK